MRWSAPTLRGFTLVEVMVVIFLMALLAGGVSLSLIGPHRLARQEDMLSHLEALDARTRQIAQEQGLTVRLVFDFDENMIQQILCKSDGEETLNQWRIPDGFFLEKILLPGRECDRGELPLSCSSLGVMPTYAILIRHSDQLLAILFAGLSGQPVRLESADGLTEALNHMEKTSLVKR